MSNIADSIVFHMFNSAGIVLKAFSSCWFEICVNFLSDYLFRTGQRSTMGLFRDGYNSLMRYVLNNFFDGFRQVGKMFCLKNIFFFY
jgi:hypothetical protein